MLPSLDVHPAVVPARMPWFVGVAPSILAIAVGGVLAMQFRSSTSRVAPRFVLTHSLVAAFWLALVVGAALFTSWVTERSLLVGLLFSLGIAGCAFVGSGATGWFIEGRGGGRKG